MLTPDGFLDISNSQLSELPCGIGAIRSLNASGNGLKLVNNEKEWGDTLRVLNLANNSLRGYSAQGLSRLRVLNLSSNNLTRLDISKPTTLVEIIANDNRIVSVSGLDRLVNLEMLELSGNLLDEHSFECNMSSPSALSILDLTGNKLESLEIVANTFPRTLQALYIGKNPIKSLSKLCPLSTFPKLSAIHVDGIAVLQSGSLSEKHMMTFLLFLIPSLCAVNQTVVQPTDRELSGTLFKEHGKESMNDELLSLVMPGREGELASYLASFCHRTTTIAARTAGATDHDSLDATSASQFFATDSQHSSGNTKTRQTLGDYVSAKNSDSGAIDMRGVIHEDDTRSGKTRPEAKDVTASTIHGIVTLQSIFRGASDRKELRDLLAAAAAAGKIQDTYRTYKLARTQRHGFVDDAEIQALKHQVNIQNEEIGRLRNNIGTLVNAIEGLTEENAASRAETEKLKLAMKYLWTEVAALREHASPPSNNT